MSNELQSSYTKLFGTIDEEDGAESRSVLSPAAYLVDLLQLRDSLISVPPDDWAGYHARRPDVRRIHLDEKTTFTEVPFLGIANEIMTEAVAALGGPPGALSTSLFPPPLPFSEQHERLKRYIEKLESTPSEIYRAYRQPADGHEIARLSLGLSVEEVGLFSTAHDSDGALMALFGTSDLAKLDGSDLELLKKKLGLSLKEIKALLRQDLDDEETSSPIEAQGRFYINQGSNYIVLTDDQRKLQLKDGSPLTNQHLDRMMRFVRLARRLKLDFVDLGWILESACGNVLDADALQAVAIILAVRKEYGLPIDEICSFWSVPKAHGRGEGPVPTDLFDRIFNNGFTSTLKELVTSLVNTNAPPDKAQARLDDRFQAALRLPGADYAFLKGALLGRGVSLPALDYSAVVPYVSALHRFAALARMLSLRVRELIVLIDVLDAQWKTAAHVDLTVAMPFPPAGGGATEPPPGSDSPLGLVLGALISPDSPPRRALNVLQKLLRVKAWLDRRELSPRQLAFICIEDHPAARDRLDDGSPIDGVLSREDIETALDDLHQALGDTLLSPSALQTGSLTPDGARAVFDSLRDARVLVAVDDPTRALLRVEPSDAELDAAMQSGIRERLQVHASDLGALGIAEIDPLLSLLVSRGVLEKVEDTSIDPTEIRYFIEAGLQGFFSASANADHFIAPGFEDQSGAIFGVLAAKVEAYQRAQNNRQAETKELGQRLSALVERQSRTWQRTLTGLLSLPGDMAELVFAFAFGTPDESPAQTLAALTVPLFAIKVQSVSASALSDAFLASRFRRLQELGLLLRKTEMSADEARVYLDNQEVHRRLPETLKLPEAFLPAAENIDALTTLPSGDFLVISGQKFATFSREDYRLLATGSLDQIPGVSLPEPFRTRVLTDGIDCAFSDVNADKKAVLHLCAGDQYVTATEAGILPPRPITDFGRVRNNIQQNARVDAAVQAEDGRLLLFSGDQYFRYSDPQQLLAGSAFVDEGYPKAIRRGLENEGLPPLPSLMFTKVDAAFRDTDDSYYFFSGNQFTHSGDPYRLVDIRPAWGHVLNHLFEENRVDAAFVLGGQTFLTRRDQVIRYSGSAYAFVDEGYPVSFANIPESDALLRVLKRFPAGVDATLAGKDQNLYAFKNGLYASSAEPDAPVEIKERWGRVRNEFVTNERVDATLAYNGSVYLFCGDQYVRYSGSHDDYVDEGYPRRVRPNWNQIEQIGLIPDALPLPITATAVGNSGEVFFFGGTRFAGPGGTQGEIGEQWARVRNNIEQLGRVDAALLDGTGRLFLFCSDQYCRYTNLDQEFVDEGYPRRLDGNWALEGAGWALPGAFASGVSAALRAPDGRHFLFSGQQYARVDTTAQTRPVNQDWGLVRNWIATNSRVNAAFLDPQGRTYLFGGDQFVLYSTHSYDFVDEGYPKAIGDKWGNLPASFRQGIDAALSFTVNGVQRLYLFKGREFVRYSNGNYSQIDAGYPRSIDAGEQSEGQWFRGLAVNQPDSHSANNELIAVEAIYVDTFAGMPRIYVFYNRPSDNEQWTREYRFEGGSYRWTGPVRLATLAGYAPFTRIEAALSAADGTLHLFSGERYAFRAPGGGALSSPVFTRERWARVWNQFQQLGRIDASLVLPDGHTYLFCAQQFIRYTGALRPGDGDFFADEGYPKKIAPGFGAEGVPIALPPELQAEGYAMFRDASGTIHLFDGAQYTRSGDPGGQPVATRWGRVDNRFRQLGRVDAAYRAENDKLYLFCDNQYTRYSGGLRPGAPDFYADEGYPRRISTGFQSEGLAGTMPSSFAAFGYAILRDAQQTHVFSGASFTSSQGTGPEPVIPRWARVRNQIQSQNRIDAGFVLGQGSGAVTLLFCDDQYVRYSDQYDGFVDEGYPKVIAHLPAVERIFASLPSQFFSGVRAFFAGTDGNLHVFTPLPADPAEPQLHVSSSDPGAVLSLNLTWGVVDNKLFDQQFVNAALLSADHKLFLFSGDQYVRYSGANRIYVDEGYPKKVATGYAQEIGATGLAAVLDTGVDAALRVGDKSFYFAGDRVVSTDDPTTAQPLVARWGLLDNRLQANQKIDAGLIAPNGKLHLFAGSQYFIYSGADREYVDEGYPKTIATNLGRLWPHTGIDFQTDLDTTATFEGRSYLFKGPKHVRISDFRLEQPDADYPLDTAAKFVERYDFELGALPDYWDFKQLSGDFSSQTTTILQYFDDPQMGSIDDLALVTQWTPVEITGLLTAYSINAGQLKDSRTVARLARGFSLAERLGTTPKKLQAQVWDPVFGANPDFTAAADFLYGLIKAATDPKDWPEVERALRDPLDAANRDALVAHLVHRLELGNANDLYERLLTDVQMSSSSTTSRIVEAINSIQLYYHRALIHLEDLKSDQVQSNLKAWWPWMKNYRIWEANRRVFLHPENYIRPELRTEKSEAFEELEEKLLQDEITAATVEEGYQRYLESFNEISQLRIAGGYRYSYEDENGEVQTVVFMLGFARTSPPTYYYRLGSLNADDQIDWEPWQEVGITIESERVQPVYAYNKLFLFWIETRPFNATSFEISTGDDNSYSADSQQTRQAKLMIKFSFYNFNKEWIAPQTIRLNPDDPSEPELLPSVFSADSADDVVLYARNPVKPGPGDLPDYIFLKLRYLFWELNVGRLTAGLDLERVDRFWHFISFSLTDATAEFPTQIGIKQSQVTAIVPWGSHLEKDTPWFSFESKGGSFLCRPVNVPSPSLGTIRGRSFAAVSAAFGTSAGDVFVFTSENDGGADKLCYYQYSEAQTSWEGPVFVDDPAWPWGRPPGVFKQDPSKRIDNVVVAVDHTTYFMVGSKYFTYPSSGYGAIEQRYAKDLESGPPALDVLVGKSTPELSWAASLAAGRDLVGAFKYIDGQNEKAVLVTRHNGLLAYVTIDLDELRQAAVGQDGTSPFDAWDGLDAVFLVMHPTPRLVFSNRKHLVILSWSSKVWATSTLGVLPGNGARLSAAFWGVDDKLYFFSGDHYSEASPLDLTGNQLSLPVAARWGRPSLFSWLLTSVDGALIGPDDKLYLFGKDKGEGAPPLGYCLSYPSFDPVALDKLEVPDVDPPKVPAVWTSSYEGAPSLEVVTAAFQRNGRAYLFGRRNSDGQTFTARYSQSTQSPFVPDPGYPTPLPGTFTSLSTDFYAGVLTADQTYSITRLTSHTVEQFSQRLFAGGIRKLLSLETQKLEELPRFLETGTPGPNELVVNPHFVSEYPGKSSPGGLDFASSNGFYYREIFFHIPFLIAQALKQAQRFQEAKTWYEYVFDPTSQQGGAHYWQFIEFLTDTDKKPLQPQIDAYRDDPFDPHKIAELRPIAYRKAFVMSYIDNLIEWGDMLFRQYTRESIGEATMLYVLAGDLLGRMPEEVGRPRLAQPDSLTYEQIRGLETTVLDEEILRLENGVPPVQGLPPAIQTPNDSIFNPYFYIPENEQFVGYWDRVGDRLSKIRNGLNIDGVRQSLALFAPPVDVMALVRAFAGGGGLAQALSDFNSPVPHYRFTFMLAKARELTARLTQLGSALLSALEKRDAEELALLRNTQERGILEMTLQIRQQQLESARQSLAALRVGLKNARTREAHYQRLLAEGLSVHETEQIGQMVVAQMFSQVSNVMNIASSIGSFVPQVGSPFAMTYGGQQIGAGLAGLAQAFRSLSEGLTFGSTLAATLGGWDRRRQEWELQKALATGEAEQIGEQIRGAEIQVDIARQEVQVQRRQIRNNLSVDTFMNSKFTSRQLYQWMVGRLSAVYFQTYQIALDYAKAAQRALQFEMGQPESEFQYIGVQYWDSLRKGLLSGEQLQLDLDRLEKAYLERNQRRLEITRYVSLAQVDPLALIKLKERGICEIDLREELFDADFPGHYCRQIKTVSLSFPAIVGPYENFNATLMQLAHRTLLSPDKAALNYLLKGPSQQAGQPSQPPASVLRVDWRPNQQLALSRGTNDSGLFQLNYQDERYLPFEGTGAVSTWRLEINGVDGQRHRESLSDVILTLQYTALPGGDAFAETVKNAIGGQARDRLWLLNLAYDFPDEWQAFMNKPADGLSFAVERRRLPGASSKQVTGVYLHYDLTEDPTDDLSRQSISLNDMVLKPGSSKTGLSLPLVDKGQDPAKFDNRWRLKPPGAAAKKFTRENIRSIALIVTYSSKPSF